MKIIVERGEFREILLYLVGCEYGICIRDIFWRIFRIKKWEGISIYIYIIVIGV